MEKIHELYETLRLNLATNPTSEKTIFINLFRVIQNARDTAMSSDLSFCFKFTLPTGIVSKLPKYMSGYNEGDKSPKKFWTINEQTVFDAFSNDWGPEAMTNNMHKNSYYQILLLLVYYGIMENKSNITESALVIILQRLWNGRKTKYLKYCDENIMRYVVARKCNGRHLFAKYDDPMSMIQDHFMPTLLKKYAPSIKRDRSGFWLKRLFEQAWGRLDQQWIRNMRTDIDTGEKRAQAGILKLYIDAKAEGSTMSANKVYGMNDDAPTFDEHTTTSNRDEIVSSACDFITMNSTYQYPTSVINKINKNTKIAYRTVEKILLGLHNHTYYDLVSDIISLILFSTGVQQKNDICSVEYDTLIKQKVISSKNNSEAQQMQKLTTKLLQLIFKNQFDVRYDSFSQVHQIQLRSAIIQGLVYNLKRSQCSGS